VTGRVIVLRADAVSLPLPDCSVDAVVCDPPYNIAFLGSAWDSLGAGEAFGDWCEAWAAECLRVLKPGGYLAAFGATRTYHWLACGIERAGFEIRDSLHWMYGTGGPKGNACLKPAHEPVVLARKPARKSAPLPGLAAFRVAPGGMSAVAPDGGGRWPANALLSHAEGCQPAGMRVIAGNMRLNPTVQAARENVAKGAERQRVRGVRGVGNPDGTETVRVWDCAPGCAVGELDQGQGGVSRYFPVFRYEAKAPASERPILPDGTQWSAVKPVALMRWLVRLVTPPGGRVLDLFCGTGATGQACALEGLDAVLLDRDPQAIALARVRLAKPVQPSLFGEAS
jgi:hypothetical protein